MKKILSIIVILLIGFGLGILMDKYVFNRSKPISIPPVVVPDTVYIEEQNKIDTLWRTEIKEKERAGKVRDSIQIITKLKYISVDSVKRLPLDSGMIYLKNKLEEYEDKYED